MILLPAIDLQDGKCVRLFQGDYASAQVVSADPVSTALRFQEAGARWIHMVDLDGAREGVPKNHKLIFDVLERADTHVEVGGGIRNMEAVKFYLDRGVSRVILGSAALRDPDFVREAVGAYGKRIAVSIDALDGKVAAEGGTEQSNVDYIELGRQVEAMGVQYIIFTDLSKGGTMDGPNLVMLDKLNRAVGCNIIASGGVSTLLDLVDLFDLGLYGVVAGKSIYNGTLDLATAIAACHKISGKKPKTAAAFDDEIERYFRKADLLPAVIQDDETGEVLMLAHMSRASLKKSLETGEPWFYSRRRKMLWRRDEFGQRVVGIWADRDDDSLLLRVRKTGLESHAESTSRFCKRLSPEEGLPWEGKST